MTQYFIFGGTGFIGTHLTNLLNEVRPECKVYNLDVVDPSEIETALKQKTASWATVKDYKPALKAGQKHGATFIRCDVRKPIVLPECIVPTEDDVIFKVCHKLLRLHYQSAEFTVTQQLVLELCLAHGLDQRRYIGDNVVCLRAYLGVIFALCTEATDILHGQLIEFLNGGHTDGVHLQFLLFRRYGVQTLIVLILDSFLRGEVGGDSCCTPWVYYHSPCGMGRNYTDKCHHCNECCF